MKSKIAVFFSLLILAASVLTGCGSGKFTIEEAQKGVVRVVQLVRVEYYAVENGQITDLIQSADGMLGGSGTAFGVGSAGNTTDIFVTNRHVVSGSSGIIQLQGRNGNDVPVYYTTTVTAVYILLDDYSYDSSNGLDKSRAVPCSIVYKAEDNGPDLAVLRASEPVEGRMALPLLDPVDHVHLGDTVYAMGFPGSADALTWDPSTKVDKLLASVDSMTVTKGSVTLLGHDAESDTDILQHDVQTNSGNSGSPLITEDGAVVAVHYASYTTGGRLETVSKLSVQSGELMDILDDLKISYDIYRSGASPVLILCIVIAVLAVIAAAVVVAVLLGKKKSKSKLPEGTARGDMRRTGVSGTEAVPGSEYRIQGKSGVFAGRRFAVAGQVRMGRDPAENDLVYPAGTSGISGRHCVVSLSGGSLTLTDSGSRYGTFLDGGRRLTPGQPVSLRIGDRFYLGSEKESFVITGKGGNLT